MEDQTVSPMMWAVLAGMVGLLIAAAIASIAFNLRQHGKLVAQFRKLAEKFDLELTIPEATMGGLYRRSPTLYGRSNGHEMSIFAKGYGLDNTRQTDTAVRVSTRANPAFQFTLAPRNFSGKLGQLGRLKETPTGDRAFDEKYSLRSSDPDAAKALFNEACRARIAQTWPPVEAFLSLHDGILMFLRFGLPYDDTAREQVAQMAEFAVVLSEDL
ncbi:MAG: hypothetical protein ACQKBV_10680 [Puniceicoccales bacterium]